MTDRATPAAGGHRRLALACAVAASLTALAGAAVAVSLGPLTAQSIRDEPLRAVVALDDVRGDAAPAVRIASSTTYRRLGFARDPALDGAELRVVTEPDGKRFVRVSTNTPVAAAELVLVLEADGAPERVYRVPLGSNEPADRVNVRGLDLVVRPTVTADRPVTDRPVTDTPRARATGVRDEPAPVVARGVDAPAQPGAPGQANAPLAPTARPSTVVPADGVELDALARALRPPGATLEQAAIALWRANRAAFVGRPPRPRPGVELTVPSENDVLSIDPSQARLEIAALSAERTAATPGDTAVSLPSTSDTTARARPDRGLGTAMPPVPPTAAAGARATAGSSAVPAASSTALSATRSATATASPPTAQPASPPAPRPARPVIVATAPPAPTSRLVLSAPTSPSRGKGPADAAFDAELAATLERLRALERKLAELREGFETNARKQESLMTELITVLRGARPASVTAAASQPVRP
jgi:pilus assembly protein FimV